MGNAPACSGCFSDISRQLPLAQAAAFEANFDPVGLSGSDVVSVAMMGRPGAGANDGLYQDPGAALGDSSEVSRDCLSDDGSCNHSAAASDSTADSATPDMGHQAQHVVKKFVRALVKGREVSVLTVNGGTAQCIASLDRNLTTLSLQRTGKNKDSKKRGILLVDISEVSVGEQAADELGLAVDELCVTLLLEDGNAVGFHFADIEERDTFALCLSMFVDGRRGEVQRHKKEKV